MAEVDTSLHPLLSGAAATLASAHSSPHPLKLYGGWFCPFVQRTWITLVEKGIPHQYIEINPYKKDPEFLALNPRGLVPTLAVPAGAKGQEQKPLYESGVVCEYLDEAYAEVDKYGLRLLPEDPYERARARLWIDHISSKIVPLFYKLLQQQPSKAYTLDEARKELHSRIRAFVEEMDKEGPFFLGEQFSMVDIMLVPWAKRLWLIDHYKDGGTGIPKTRCDETWQRWNKWFEAAMNRESVKQTWSDDGRYIEAYKRYADDNTNSEVAQATRQGNRLP